jgi:predicted TIM-barrel fold metal-dependent hydrolase
MRYIIAISVLLLATACGPQPAVQTPVEDSRLPIIDMHLHAFRLPDGAGPPANPVTGLPSTADSDVELRELSLAALQRYNIVKAVASGPAEVVAQWSDAAPGRVLAGAFVDEQNPLPDPATLRADIQAGRIHVLGELGLQYRGMAPNDPRLEPYYALAEELDIPVGIHTGIGPAGTPYLPGSEGFRVTLGNPILVEDVLIRHPRLRLYLMHGGAPFLQETKAILAVYPQVYVDLAAINWVLPREEFHSYLQELMRAGFGKRLLFGSDQMFWPEAIGMAVEGIESAAFLTAQEKRDIFYNNAVRFLRLERS